MVELQHEGFNFIKLTMHVFLLLPSLPSEAKAESWCKFQWTTPSIRLEELQSNQIGSEERFVSARSRVRWQDK
jgi:hypothetical protein